MEAARGGAGMRSAPLVLALVLVVALALAGCGSSSNHGATNVSVATSTTSTGNGKTFSAKGMAVHFTFPDNFRVIPLAPSKRTVGKSGGSSHAAVGVGTYDLLVVAHFPGAYKVPVTTKLMTAVKQNTDQLMTSLVGRSMSGTVTTIAGEPALTYPRVPTVGLPVTATVQISNVFVGKDEYELECQATPARLATIEAACQQMVDTMTVSK
jgi:hypothetical protein